MTTYLLPLLWLLSFAAALMPIPAYESHCVTLAVAVLAVCLSFVILKHPFRENAAPLSAAFFTPVLAFWGLAFVSVVLSAVPMTSFIYFGFFSVFPLSLFCSVFAKDKVRFFKVAGTGLAVIFAAFSTWCLVQFFALPGMLIYGRVHWPFADPNSLGGLMSLGFFGAFGLMIAAENRVQSNAGLLLAVLTMGALLTTGSRGAVVALALGLILFAVLNRAQIRKHKRCGGLLIIAAAILLGATQYHASVGGAESVGYRIGETIRGAEPIFWSRGDIWASAWQIIHQHFWTGTGIGTFFLYYQEVRGAGDANSAGRMAHSDPLQYWAEMGVLAPVLFYLMIAMMIVITVKAVRLVPRDDVRRVHILIPFCALGAMVLQTHITFHLNTFSILALTGLLMGYWFWRVSDVLGGAFAGWKALRLPQGEILKLVTVAPLLAGLYGFLMLQSSYIMFYQGDAAGQAGDLPGFARDINKAGVMAMQHNDEVFMMAARVKLSALQAQGAMPSPDAGQIYDEGIALLDKAAAVNPRSEYIPFYRSQFARASKLLRLEKPEDEEKLLLESLRLNPTYFDARLALAQYYRRHDAQQKAYDVLHEGMKWYKAAPVPREYYELLATVALEQGEMDVHEFALRMMARSLRRGA